MSKPAVVVSTLLFVLLAGCGGSAMTKAEAPAEPPKPTLTADAQAALKQAQSDVKNANSQGALWTTAEAALKAAEEAAKAGDSEGVLKNAQVASTQAKLGIEQTSYPSTDQFK